MAPVPQKSLADLITPMKGQNSLVDYDVLVSYSQEAVNKVLAKRAKDIGALDEYSEVTASKDVWDNPTHVTVTVTFENFSLEFPDSNGNVIIYIPFSGSTKTTLDSDPTKVAKTSYGKVQMYLKTALQNIKGKVDDKGLFYSDGEKKHSAGNVVQMEADKNVTQGVFLDFPDDVNIAVKNTDDGKMSDADLTSLKNQLESTVKNRLKKLGFRFVLKAVNNTSTTIQYKSSDKSTSVIFQPRSFSFLTVSGTSPTGRLAAGLCTWIVLKDNPNQGDKDPQAFSPGPARDPIDPIPVGNSASIIFSHRAMANLFLLPGLRTSLDNVKCTSVVGQDGMAFTFNFKSISITIPAYEKRDGNNYLLQIDGCKFNLNSPLATARIIADNTGTPLSLSWTSKTQELKWSETWSTGVSYGGTVKLQFTLQGSASWKADSDTSAHPNRVTLAFSFQPSFAVKVEAGSQSFWEKVFGGREWIPDHVKNVHLDTPTISVDVKPMDYFLTTNLLFPGKHIFHADDPGKAGGKGMATPRDTILTGEVKLKA